ncbi:MAG: MepB family protein [Bacteroidota bacterium]
MDSVHPDLAIAKKQLYANNNLEQTNFKAEKESAEYAASTFTLNNLAVIYRVAKITPTKNGQFVTIWKRNSKGITEPFHVSDSFDFIIISVRNEANIGQFIFPKSVLLQQKIISGNNKEGKRGMRVYPPWDKPMSKQAEKTQEWQLKHFFSINNSLSSVELAQLKKLF